MSADAPVLPVSVIGGYLGAGKTTLINRLLRRADGLRLAVLVNDFGEVSIDADLIEAGDEQVLQLAGGCVCCSIGSDLMATLTSLRERFGNIDRVLLETSGVALPGVVAATVALAPGVSCDAVIVLADAVDAMRGLDDRYLGDTISRQFASADLILLSKADLATDDQRTRLGAALARIAPHAPLLTADDALPTGIVLGTGLTADPSGTGPGGAPNESGESVAQRPFRLSRAHAAAELFVSRVWVNEAGADIAALERVLSDADSALIRAKGLVADEQGQAWLIQSVGRRTRIVPAHRSGASFGHLLVIHARQVPPSVRFDRAMAGLGFAILAKRVAAG